MLHRQFLKFANKGNEESADQWLVIKTSEATKQCMHAMQDCLATCSREFTHKARDVSLSCSLM